MKQWTSIYFILFFHFIFNYFTFSIFRTLRLGLEVIGYTVTSVASDGKITILIIELERKE